MLVVSDPLESITFELIPFNVEDNCWLCSVEKKLALFYYKIYNYIQLW